MKKSGIEFINPDTNGAPLDKYFVSNFTNTTKEFLSVHSGDSVSISSKLDDLFFINICSMPAARFLHKIINIQRDGTLKIHMQDIDDMFYILIKTEGELRITDDEREEIIKLARSAGFYISVNEEIGTVIAKCEIERTTSVIVQAITLPCLFRDYLEIAFEKN